MFDRLIALIGQENFEKIQKTKVLLFGIGGVGGYVAESLIRSGIVNLTIVDKDTIDISNLNRQIIALHSTINKSKVDIMKERLIDINPNSSIATIKENLKEDNLNQFGLENYDYIIDCIDEVPAKIALIKYALKHDIKFITSTGTALKLHPELLKITTLDKTSYDALAKKMRTLLRGEKLNKIVCLASTEEPIKMANKTLGSSIFVPASGGLLISSYIINDIINL